MVFCLTFFDFGLGYHYDNVQCSMGWKGKRKGEKVWTKEKKINNLFI